jgi:hypothetical protein
MTLPSSARSLSGYSRAIIGRIQQYRKHLRRALMLSVAIACGPGGCAKDLSGSWETVQVRPEGASFPFNRIQFGEGTYTAFGLYDGDGRMAEDVQTTTGEYRRSGSALQIKPHKGANQSYHVRRRLDGRLEIVMTRPGGKPLTAVLAPGN